MKPLPEPPRLLLSAISLTRPARAPRERVLEVEARYREPETLAVTISKALDAGAGGVLATPGPALRAALAELRRPVPVFALWPSSPALEEEGLAPGDGPSAARTGTEAGPVQRVRRGLTGLFRMGARSRGDLVALVPMRLELEAAALPARALRGVTIAAPITDLALAAGHQRFFESVIAFCRRRFRVPAGFETRNLGHLLARLSAWGLKPDFVVGPVNPCGRLMKPDAASVLEALARREVRVLARDLRAGGMVSLEEGARYALEHGAYGVVPDLVEVDDVAAELRALAPRD